MEEGMESFFVLDHLQKIAWDAAKAEISDEAPEEEFQKKIFEKFLEAIEMELTDAFIQERVRDAT